jgi:ribosome-associated translation inhibitor RaiA
MADTFDEGEYKRTLDAKAQRTLAEASQTARLPFPTMDIERGPYLYRNIVSQDELSDLQANIDFFVSKLTTRLKQHEAALRSEHKLEGLKTKEERDASCYKNAKWADLNESVDNYKVLSNRCVQLGWILKNNYGYVSK